MKRNLSFFVLLIVGLITTCFLPIGCRLFDNNPGAPDTASLSELPGLPSSFGAAQSVSFRVVLPATLTGSSLARAADDTPEMPPNPGIIAGIRASTATSTPTVTFKLILLNIGNTANPTFTIVKTVVADASGTAMATFESVPALTCIGDIHIDGGTIGSYADFHGATDLLASSANIIEVAPKGSSLPQDIFAILVQQIQSATDLFALAKTGLVGRLVSAAVGIDIGANSACSDILSVWRMFEVPRVEVKEPILETVQSVGREGGTITIASASSPVNTLSIELAPDAFATSVNVSVSYAEIATTTFGENFKPLSPMIIIDTGGAVASTPATIRVPVTKANDEFAMAFSYDPATGKLEGLPIVGATADSVTFATRHFGSSSPGSLNLRRSILAGTSFLTSAANIVVGGIKMRLLDDISYADTGFRPGVNDCPFTNYGSYFAPSGHCNGQSLLAAWYYVNKPDARALNRLLTVAAPWYTNLSQPNAWFVDGQGYRLATMLQKDASARLGNWSFQVAKLRQLGFWSGDDLVAWRAFKYAMLETNEPQIIAMYDENGENGHAMIVYRLDPNGLWVADPNHPGKSNRFIPFGGTTFSTYYSGENALAIESGKEIPYTQFYYYGKGAMLSDSAIDEKWSKFQAKTIPWQDYRLKVVNADGITQDFTEGLSLSADTIRFAATMDDLGREFKFYAFTQKGYKTGIGSVACLLLPGENKIGLSVWATPPEIATHAWLDFRWVTVNREGWPLGVTSIEPAVVEGSFSEQKITIRGSGFQTGVKVELVEPTYGVIATFGITSDKPVVFVDSETLEINPVFGQDQTVWTVNVINADGSKAEPANFTVLAPGGALVNADDLVVVSSWRMPIGGDTGTDLRKLYRGIFPLTKYPKIRFNDNLDAAQGENEWFSITAHGRNTALHLDWNTDEIEAYNAEHPEWIHPGEDWNLNKGGDSELLPAQPVVAIGNGVVLWAGRASSNYGNCALIAHKTITGEIVSSFYAHLADPAPAFKPGTIVFKGSPLGFVGNTGPVGISAHLHFEIRRQRMVRVDPFSRSVVPAFPIEKWPPTGTTDGGAAFIGANYYEPSLFLKYGPSDAQPAPWEPSGVSAQAGDGSVSITCTPVSDAISYNVYYSTTSGVTKANGKKLPGKIPFTLVGLTNGTPYFFVVTAINAAGESVESSEVTATPKPAGLVFASYPLGVSVLEANQNIQIILTGLPWDYDTTVGLTDEGTGEIVNFVKSAALSYPNRQRIVLAASNTTLHKIASFSALQFTQLPPSGSRVEVWDPDKVLSLVATTTAGGTATSIALGTTITGATQNLQVIMNGVSETFNTRVALIDTRTREEVSLVKSAALSYPNYQRLLLGVTDSTLRTLEPFSTLVFSTAPPAGAHIEVVNPDSGQRLAEVDMPGGSGSLLSLGTSISGANQNMQIIITNVASSFTTATTLVDDRTGVTVPMSRSAALSFPNFQRLVLGTTDLSFRAFRSFDKLAFTSSLPSGAKVELFDTDRGVILTTVSVP